MADNEQLPYNVGFTAASLRPELARVVAGSFLRLGDWEAAKEHVLSSNALQCRNASSAIRLERELRQRLECLTEEELTILSTSTGDMRNAMAWLSAIKRIKFIFEFASEVLRAKLELHDPVLRRSDYDAYFETKSLTHSELQGLAASSRSKLRQVLLLMLVEAELLVPGTGLGTIRRNVLAPKVLRAILDDDPRWLAGFLFPDREIGVLR
jgi:hypothetical protein